MTSSRLAAALLAIHAGLLGWQATRISPVIDEVGHLAAGVYTWHFGQFDVYCVNPPLVRAVATLPVVLCGPKTSWTRYENAEGARPEWQLGLELIRTNGWERAFRYFILARWACIPLSLLGAFVCYRWARDLCGPASGVLALGLWCFCPTILAWGSTIGPDVAAAATGIAGAYVFWRWLREPTWGWAFGAGLSLGILELTKTTWIFLFALWPVLWLIWVWCRRASLGRREWFQQAVQLGMLLTLGLFVLNTGYAFDGSLQRLGDYTFVSRSLAGSASRPEGGDGGNRFRDRWLGQVPIPLPRQYVRGIDLQKVDFEEGRDSYLCGQWKHGGWWYYYLVCVMLKVPLGTILLAILALGLTFMRFRRPKSHRPHDQVDAAVPRAAPSRLDELTLLLPALCVMVLVSSQTGINRYFRYLLPAFPFAYIWISSVLSGSASPAISRRLTALVGVAFAWSLASSLTIFPHSISYFNELAGGPRRGHQFLVDANIDWGQDYLGLDRWLEAHPEAHPLRMAYNGLFGPEILGIETPQPPTWSELKARHPEADVESLGPEPGWYALSVHRLHEPEYEYFLRFEPIETIGYSIYIYHVLPQEGRPRCPDAG